MHYLRVQSVEQGVFVGPKADPATFAFPVEEQREWAAQAATEVEIPARLVPPDAGCYVFVRDTSAACLDDFEPPVDPDPTVAVTLVGTYQPLPYLLPAVGAKVVDSPVEVVRLGRLVSAVLALCLLALAVAAAWDPRAPGLSLLGPALAVTPMVLFCGAILNGSSLEIAAGIAFFACLLRLARDAPPTWVWAGAGVSGAAFALSRSAAPLWIALGVLVVVAVHGPRATWHTLRAGARAAIAAVAAIATAIAANVIWERTYGPDVTVDLKPGARRAFETGLDSLPRWLEELVGRFGYLEFGLPLPVYIFWGVATLAAIAGGLRWAPARGKVVLAVCALALAVLPLAQYILVQRHTGFGLQGRHVLPILVIVPLLAGELLRRAHDRFAAARVRDLVALTFAGIALAQFTALYWNGRRSAVGLDGPLVFFDGAQWSPPLGWGIWLALAAAGSACLVAAGLQAAKAEAPR